MTTVLSPNLLSQAVRSLIPLGSLRDGQIVEARVNTMLGKDVARLTLLGATLDVNTPIQLIPGSTLKVAVERSTDGLRLVLQQDANRAGAPTHAPEDAGPGGFRSLSLAIAQAVVDSALKVTQPDVEPPAAPPNSGAEASPQGQIKSSASEPPAASADRSPVTRLATDATAPFRRADDGQDKSAATRPLTGPADRGGMPAPSPAAPSASAASPTTSTIAYLPPGAAQPFNLTFVRDETERGADAQAESPGPAWTVRFSFDSPGLGPLHAAIRFGGGHVGVKIWAERADVATALERDSAELRNTLQEASLKVEAVAVMAGRPPSHNSVAASLHSSVL
jgi:hypothetical protein